MEEFKIGDRVVATACGRIGTIKSFPSFNFVTVVFDDEPRGRDQLVRRSALSLIDSENKMNQIEIFNAMHDSSGIEVGDTVEVVREWSRNEFGVDLVTQGTCKLGVVRIVREINYLPYSGTNVKHFRLTEGNVAPFFALRVVKKAKPKWEVIPVKLNDEYTASVYSNKIVVGCQTISFAALDKLVQAMSKARAYSSE